MAVSITSVTCRGFVTTPATLNGGALKLEGTLPSDAIHSYYAVGGETYTVRSDCYYETP